MTRDHNVGASDYAKKLDYQKVCQEGEPRGG